MKTNTDRPKRTIKSYASRIRMTPKQKAALQSYWTEFGVEFAQEQLQLTDLFHNQAPVILEIGFGLGSCLVELAKRHPQINFIGIEVYLAGIGATLAAINEHNLQNVRLMRADAVQVLQQMIPPESLAAILLFFPDPWPKRRHHKRRIVQADFVELVHSKLIAGGYFHLATDVLDYAIHMDEVVKSSPGFHNYQKDMSNQAFLGRPRSKFELRAIRKDILITDLVFLKK